MTVPSFKFSEKAGKTGQCEKHLAASSDLSVASCSLHEVCKATELTPEWMEAWELSREGGNRKGQEFLPSFGAAAKSRVGAIRPSLGEEYFRIFIHSCENHMHAKISSLWGVKPIK